MNHSDRAWLSKLPVLLTAYLEWVNRRRRRGRKEVLVVLAIFAAWMAVLIGYAHAEPAAALAVLRWLDRHDLLWATLSTIAAGMLVSRRRSLHRNAAFRSWTAALPVRRSTARWQAIAVASAPAFILVCVSAVAFGSVSALHLIDAGIPAPLRTWAAATLGLVLGTALGLSIPLAGKREVYEGSRYVPHRRTVEPAIPVGSLTALGRWPVRHLFASARPHTIARALMPVLLAVPVGSTAAGVMLAIGLLVTAGMFVLLVATTVAVGVKASRWLRPLPLAPRVLRQRTAGPPLVFMLLVTACGSWLIWLLGASVVWCIAGGALTWFVGAMLVVAAALSAGMPKR